MPGTPLSLPEREEIAVALIEDRTTPWASIARRIGRHPTTVMREVAANGGRGHYRPALAERLAEKQRCRPRPHRLALAGPLRERVTAELTLGRSPVAIWADLVAEGATERVCPETIYAAVYAGVLDVRATDCLRMKTASPTPPVTSRYETPRASQHRPAPGRCQRARRARSLRG